MPRRVTPSFSTSEMTSSSSRTKRGTSWPSRSSGRAGSRRSTAKTVKPSGDSARLRIRDGARRLPLRQRGKTCLQSPPFRVIGQKSGRRSRADVRSTDEDLVAAPALPRSAGAHRLLARGAARAGGARGRHARVHAASAARTVPRGGRPDRRRSATTSPASPTRRPPAATASTGARCTGAARPAQLEVTSGQLDLEW